jgi:nicotinamide riboside transporter PnuC
MGLAIIGTILNIKKMNICFFIWCFTNLAWCVIDFYKGIYFQSLQFFVYFILAIWGLYEWKFKKK